MTVPTPEMLEFLKLYVAHFEAGSGVEVLPLIIRTPTVDYTIRANLAPRASQVRIPSLATHSHVACKITDQFPYGTFGMFCLRSNVSLFNSWNSNGHCDNILKKH